MQEDKKAHVEKHRQSASSNGQMMPLNIDEPLQNRRNRNEDDFTYTPAAASARPTD
jgi:hypothetical protein